MLARTVSLAATVCLLGACQGKESSPAIASSSASGAVSTAPPSGASASSAAPSASAATPSPFPATPTNEPKDPRARVAHWYVLSLYGVFGMPDWPDKYFDTAPMQEYQKDCDAGSREACTLAAIGFERRQLFPLMQKRLFKACEAKEPAACGYFLYLQRECREHEVRGPGTGMPPPAWCDRLVLPSQGADPAAAYVRLARELCDAGLAYGCAPLPDLDEKLDDKAAWELRMRACELGAAGACSTSSLLRNYPPPDPSSPRYQAAGRAFCTVHQDATSCAWWGEIGLKDPSLVRAACAMKDSMTWEPRLCETQ